MPFSNDQGLANLGRLAARIRRHVLTMTHRAGSSHVGSSLSTADILAVLYGRVLNITPETADEPGRDRFILSKGHGCAGVYAVLAERGFFPLEWLESFHVDGSILAGHISHRGVPGVEASTGSLGHGLSIGAGLALAGLQDNNPYRVFVLLSDGECDEGSVWEAALFAAHHRLENLVAIVDYNGIQSLGKVCDVLELEPFADKWRAFGWETVEIDGHDLGAIVHALRATTTTTSQPTCIIAKTTKGKGVSFMENTVLWHYRSPSSEDLELALLELGDTE
jgi:transketolase